MERGQERRDGQAAKALAGQDALVPLHQCSDHGHVFRGGNPRQWESLLRRRATGGGKQHQARKKLFHLVRGRKGKVQRCRR